MEIALKDLGEVITGNTPSKKEESYWNSEDICFIKPDGIEDNGITLIQDSNEYISECARSKARIVSKDAVFVTCIGTIGKIGIASFGDYAFNQQINVVVPNEKVIPRYLAYNLLFSKPRLVSIANAPVVPIINKTQFGEFIISIDENIDEQKRIVNILDRLLGIIDKRKKELKVVDNLIKARFVEMFGNPFDVKTKVKWPIKTICDLSESIMDGSNVDKALYKQNGDVLFLRIQNVWCNEFKLEDSVYISEIENEEYKDTSLKHGDLLITKIGRYYTSDSSLGRVSVYLGDDDKANYSNNIMRIRFKEGINSEFINTLMNLDDYNKFIRRTSVGGTDKRALSKGLISSYPIIVPPSDKQNEFVDFLHQVDKSKVAVQKALDEAQLLFDSLMQEYFG